MAFWFILSFIILSLHLLDKHFMSYWSNLGIPQKNPSFIVGNLGANLLGFRGFGEFFLDVYEKCKSNKIIGLYFFHRPVLCINDPELIQDVLIRDFNNFHDRSNPVNEEKNPLSAHLFSLTGQRWRDLRVKLSPTFTSGKLKAMYPTINDCSKVLEEYLVKNVDEGKREIEFRDLFARYTTNVISSVAFGVDNDCINDPENIFRKMGLRIFETNFKKSFLRFLVISMPRIFARLNAKSADEVVEEFFFDLVGKTIDFREKNKNYERKDFMQLLIQLKNQGFVSVDKNDEESSVVKQLKIKNITFNDIVAQSFLFFFAGFETSSATMNFCLIELCKNLKIQQKVQEELDNVVNEDELTYENLNDLKYLECCIDETLRKYPIVPMLNRVCTNDFKFSNTNFVIEKGTQVFIPVLGLHRDPKIFENPLEFKPERFLNSPNGNGISKGIFYLPFGDGPRNCIGARMGKLQTKLGLAAILKKFSFELVDKTWLNKEISFDPRLIVIAPRDNVMIKVTKRNLKQ